MTKIYKCEECGNPLRYMGSDQYMCDQNGTLCKNSLKVSLIHEEE